MAELPAPVPHTVNAIYAWHEARRSGGMSDGIAISQLGDECDRRLWYAFRWIFAAESFSGRMLRLFETGEREEVRMLAELRAIGCEVSGEQERVRACGEHLRGKLDGRVIGLPEAPKTEHIIECKTHSLKNFKAVQKHGVKHAKFAHWVQMQIYMHLTGLQRALYMAHCKDTDDLYTERVEYDLVFCARAVARAERIIAAHEPPQKLHENPASRAAFQCSYCPAKGVCHESAEPRRTCRSCISATPIAGGWHCDRLNIPLDRDAQQKGCPDHRYLPKLVHGQQVDYVLETHQLIYEMPDGSEWIDGGCQ
jgi:hypothetical protein